MEWMARIRRMDIGASIVERDLAVGRLTSNRFIVLRDGEVQDFGGDRSKVGLVVARVYEAVTGDYVTAPCADCGAPRENRAYCRACYSARVQKSKRGE